ncbi:hypothetical protein FQZ97_851510 [compost metagenome]
MQDFCGHGFYHGLHRHLHQSLLAKVALDQNRLRLRRLGRGPGLAVERAGEGDFQRAPEVGGVFHGLDHECLPFELPFGHALHLQATDAQGIGARTRYEALKEAQIAAQDLVVGFELANLQHELRLRGLFGRQQAFGRVGHGLRLAQFGPQHLHFGAQLLQFLLGVAVQAGNVLAELEGPQRQGAGKAQDHCPQEPAKRPRQGAAHRDPGRAHRQPSAQQAKPHSLTLQRFRRPRGPSKSKKPPQDELVGGFCGRSPAL